MKWISISFSMFLRTGFQTLKLKFWRSIFLVLQFFAISIVKIKFTLFSSSSLSQHIIQPISKILFKFSVGILQSKFLLLWCFGVQIEKLFLVMEDRVDSLLSFYSSFVVRICFLFRLFMGFFYEIDEAIYFWLFYHCFYYIYDWIVRVSWGE